MKIKISEKYHVEHDSFRGVVLVFQETRTRKKLDKKTKKETGETEDFLYVDKFFYPNLQMALEKYIFLTQTEDRTLTEYMDFLEAFDKKLEEFRLFFDKSGKFMVKL